LDGPLLWRDNRPLGTASTMTLGTATFVATVVCAAMTTAASGGREHLWSATGTTALMIVFAPSAATIISNRPVPHGLLRIFPWVRAVSTVVAALALWHVLVAGVVLLSLAYGLEAAITLELVGIRNQTIRALRFAVLSPFHIGVAFGMLACAVALRVPEPAFTYILMLISVLAGFSACAAAQHWCQSKEAQESNAFRSQRERDARYFAGWLHDQVSNPVRLLRLRAAEGQLDLPTLTSELDRLEAMLREGQVDHLVEAGVARLRDVAGPYLRLAERHGVNIADTPDAVVGSLALQTSSARLASRTIGILVNNALQAGARSISLRATHELDTLRLEVEDDAGGFDTTRSHFGRSLTDLHDSLNGRLELRKTAEGSLIVAVVPLA
jgi:signal transduction histidine kinase